MPGAKLLGSVKIDYRSIPETVRVYEVPGSAGGVTNVVLDHAGFESLSGNPIYSEDVPTRPFASDDSRFALYGAAAAAWIDELETRPDVVHLHNVQNVGAVSACLDSVPTIFTAHDYRYLCPASTFYFRRKREICHRTCGPGCFASAITRDDKVREQLYTARSPAHAFDIIHAHDDINYFLDDAIQSAGSSGIMPRVSDDSLNS